MSLPGLSLAFKPHPHRYAAVARIVGEPGVGQLHGQQPAGVRRGLVGQLDDDDGASGVEGVQGQHEELTAADAGVWIDPPAPRDGVNEVLVVTAGLKLAPARPARGGSIRDLLQGR